MVSLMIQSTEIVLKHSYSYAEVMFERSPDKEYAEHVANIYISENIDEANLHIHETLNEIFNNQLEKFFTVDVCTEVSTYDTSIYRDPYDEYIDEYRLNINVWMQSTVSIKIKDVNITTLNHLKLKCPKVAEPWSCINSENMGVHNGLFSIKRIFIPFTNWLVSI